MIYTVTLNPALDKEYTVDELKQDEVLRALAVSIDYGGKGFNVSRMLHSLGVDNTALGFVGGATGQTIERGLAELNIKTALTGIREETRTNISIVSEKEKHYIKVNEPGPLISKEEIDHLLQQVDEFVHPNDWWVLAGSLPRGVPNDFYANLINHIHQGGAFAVLDTSGQALQQGLKAHPFLIKPNITETSQLISREINNLSEVRDALPFLHTMGAEIVVISAGEEGALLSNGEKVWHCQAPKIQERNPIGAGDAMVAGLVWRLSLQDDMGQVLAWGIACGTAAASLAGTGMPNRNLVEKFLNEVKVKRI